MLSQYGVYVTLIISGHLHRIHYLCNTFPSRRKSHFFKALNRCFGYPLQ